MSRLHPQHQGHRVMAPGAGDIDQRLTYQQLLNLNHDYAKENALLKNIQNRLGEELRALHTQFERRSREQNNELYNAINEHPNLQRYQQTLVPLLEAYELKIQDFEHQFEGIHEEYFSLEKKFEETCKENERLNLKLTETTKELLEVYKNGESEAMHSDFGQLILDQVNEKQRLLITENAKLNQDYERYKSEAERSKNEVEGLKERLEEARGKIKDYEISQRQIDVQIKNLKDNCFDLQIKNNEMEAEKRKLEQAHERAQSQNNNLNKEKEMYKTKLEDFKVRMQKENQAPYDSNDQRKIIEQLNTKISFLQAEKGPSDIHKKFTKLQKEFDALTKDKNRLKEAADITKNREDELNDNIMELRSKISGLEAEKTSLQLNENKIKRSLENLAQKSKNEVLKVKKSCSEEIERIESEYKHKIDMKDKQIADLQQKIERIELEKEKISKQLQINGKKDKQKNEKDSERTIRKLQQKIQINDELFKEHIQIFENDLAFLKKQNDSLKVQCKQKGDQLKKLKIDHENLLKKYEDVSKEKNALLEEFRKVRDQYEVHLKDKEVIFEEKIREIKSVVQDSDNRRRAERERVQEASREYKRVLEDIKATYEARIRQLEGQGQSATQTRYRVETYSGTPGN